MLSWTLLPGRRLLLTSGRRAEPAMEWSGRSTSRRWSHHCSRMKLFTWSTEGATRMRPLTSAVEVKHPHECLAACGAGYPSSPKCSRHLLWRASKGPKPVAFQPPQEVLQRNEGTHIPTISGISDRE